MKSSPRLMPTCRFSTRICLKAGAAFLLPLVFALLSSPASHAQDARAATPAGESHARGTITGRIVSDDGQTLSNVRVVAFRMGGAPDSNANAMSDGEGKFSFGNLVSGSYSLNVFVPGYTLEPATPSDPSARTYYRLGDSATLRMIKGGVITGTVTHANGDPVVGVSVVAVRLRLADGRATNELGASGQPRLTDDRGVYRIYGLRPGTYIVRAGGRGFSGRHTAYDTDVPTYHPSSPRDAASEVIVHAGGEMTGVDIRYRGEPGHAVSGTISGALPAAAADPSVAAGTVLILLRHVSASAPELLTSLQPGALNNGFSFDAVADGDYEIAARTTSPRPTDLAAAPPRRVTVRGADVGGINLTLAPLASVSGQLLFEAAQSPGSKTTCQPAARQPRPEEAIIFAGRDDGGARDQNFSLFPGANDSAPDGKGVFLIRNLQAGLYRPGVRLPGEDFYVRALTLTNAPAITMPAVKTATATASPARGGATTPAPQAAGDAAARNGLSLQAGERLTGFNIYVAAGAAGLRGRVISPTATAADDASPDARTLRVYLVPAEPEQTDNVLRYAETHIGADGAYAFTNLAPGRYRLVARRAPDREQSGGGGGASRPLVWDAAARAALRREAESANVALDLVPCQRVVDFVLQSQPK